MTGAAPIVPLALATTQVCGGEVGCVLTVTAYEAPLASGVANANAPSEETERSSPPLLRSTNPLPTRPPTMTPTAYAFVAHATATFVTFAPPIVPPPLVTTHVCVGVVGCVITVTAYDAPLATPVSNVNAPFAPKAR